MIKCLALSVRSELMVEMLSNCVLVVMALIIMELDNLAALVVEMNFVPLIMLLTISFV
jgi:hypothetical protein